MPSRFQRARSQFVIHASRFSIFDIILASLRLKPRPYKLLVFPLKTKEVHQHSMILCALILLVAGIFSGWLFDDPLATFADDACLSPAGQIDLYAEEVKNFTGWYESYQLRRQLNATARQFYNDAKNIDRDCSGYSEGRCAWPRPYNSECKIIYRTIPKRCATHLSWFERIFFDDVCIPAQKVAFDPCAEDTNFDASAQEASAVPEFKRTNETDKIENTVAKVVREVVHRAQFASSIYCVWVATMIFIGPAYHIYSYSLKTRLQNMLLINKPLFMVLVVVLWYVIESVRTFMIENPGMMRIFALAQGDPCFVDSEFLTELQDTFATICSQIGENQRAFQHINSVIEYYTEVEGTWIDVNRNDGKNVYGAYVTPKWSPGCNANENALDILSVPETNSNGYFYLANSGYIAAIFIQPLLVNLIWYIFELLKPLCGFHGRVIADPKYCVTDDPHGFDKFIRAQYVLSLVFTLIMLSFVVINQFI